MKSNLFSALLLLTSLLSFSQTSNDKTIYLDSLWQETSQGNHKYYMVIKDYYTEKESYKIYNYYQSGAIQMEGTSKTKDAMLRDGECIFYYENGNKKIITNYVKSRPNGKCFEWYENGNKKLEGEYIEDEKTFFGELKINQFWDANNVQKVIDGNGDYEDVGEKSFASGKIKNGFKDGFWQGYDKKTGYTYSETYENHKLISGISIDSNKVSHTYKVVELKPIPRRGYEHFYKYVGKNINIPKKYDNISGKIIIQFIVNKEGEVVEPKIIKSLNYDLDIEALRVLTSYGKWSAGEIRGIKVKCTFSLPITIIPYK